MDLEAQLEAARQFIRRPINEILPPGLLLRLIPPPPSWHWIAAFFLLAVILVTRVYFILPGHSRVPMEKSRGPRASRKQCTVAVFLGSGGHTTELVQLVSALPAERYSHRIYLISSGDDFSLRKAQILEKQVNPTSSHAIEVLQIPRARRVHQSFLTTPFSLLWSIVFCIDHVALRPIWNAIVQTGKLNGSVYADVFLMNGPGTCVPIVAAVYCLRVIGLPSPKLIYTESFARVKSLSLTAKLIRPFVDRFVLQWPPLQQPRRDGNTVYSGWLV